MQSCPIPRHLDDMPKIVFWEMDQAMLFMLMLVLGIASNMPLVFGVIGAVVAWAFGKMKHGKHRGFSKHLLYWTLPFQFYTRTPPSHLREFVG